MFKKIALAAALLGMASCATIHINVIFPQEKIESAAESFLLEIEEGNGAGAAPVNSPDRFLALNLLGPRPLHARTVSAQVTMQSPVIDEARERMRERVGEIRDFKVRGLIGENRVGLVEVAAGREEIDALAQDERVLLYRLVSEENHDRMNVYREVVRINSMPREELSRVQESFANVYRRLARPGEWVQQTDGPWTRKDESD